MQVKAGYFELVQLTSRLTLSPVVEHILITKHGRNNILINVVKGTMHDIFQQ